MAKEKKIKIYSDKDTLQLTLNWFSPRAYYFAFFTAFWNAFLMVWYFLVFGANTPIIFKLVPLIHVVAGIWLLYYTLCLFFNKSYLDIDGDYLIVEHKPFPWWTGNKGIPINEIQQLYVKQNISQSDNSTSYNYELRAKLIDNREENLLSIEGMESHELKEIEDQLEEFMGIADEPVIGEYGRSTNKKIKPKPRRQRRDFSHSEFSPLYQSSIDEEIEFKGENLDLINITQYDWEDGNSDKLFQLINFQKQEKLIHLQQNDALIFPYFAKPLSLLEVGNIVFNIKKPPTILQFKNREYHLSENQKGKKFNSGNRAPINVEQWFYKSKEEEDIIQVVAAESTIKFYKLSKLSISDFEESLDLNALPEENLDYPEQDINDEDFV